MSRVTWGILTQDDGRIVHAACHYARDVHGVNEGDETVSGQQTISGLQGHDATQRPGVSCGSARV